MDMDTYTGAYALRQWIVLLLILAMPVAGIWWSTGVMRCALRMQREGHHFLFAGSGFVVGTIILTHVVFINPDSSLEISGQELVGRSTRDL
jgi:hypothetical protein